MSRIRLVGPTLANGSENIMGTWDCPIGRSLVSGAFGDARARSEDLFDEKDLQNEKHSSSVENLETHGVMMSTIVLESLDGYSAENELMKVTFRNLFPLKLKWDP